VELITDAKDEVFASDDTIVALFRRNPDVAPFDIVFNSLRAVIAERDAERKLADEGHREYAAAVAAKEEAERDLQAEKDVAQAAFNVAQEAEGKLCAARELFEKMHFQIEVDSSVCDIRTKFTALREYVQDGLVALSSSTPCRHEAEAKRLREALEWAIANVPTKERHDAYPEFYKAELRRRADAAKGGK
jgi:hypothetical protein